MSNIKIFIISRSLFLEEFELSNTIWKFYMFNIPRNTVKFLHNSVLDTLPTNSNLMRLCNDPPLNVSCAHIMRHNYTLLLSLCAKGC